MDSDHATLLCEADDAVDIEIRSGVGTEQQEFLSGGGGRRGLVDIGGGHDSHGVETFAYGAAYTACRDAPVCNQNSLAPNLFHHLFKRLDGHSLLVVRADRQAFRPPGCLYALQKE